MDELLSRFPDIAEDLFESLDDESLVRCKEAGRSLSSFMDECTKFWKRIIRKYLHYQEKNDFKESWETLMDLKQTKPEMLKELGQAVQQFLDRHEGRVSIQGVKSLWGYRVVFPRLGIGDTDRWRINKGLSATCQCPRGPILEKRREPNKVI